MTKGNERPLVVAAVVGVLVLGGAVYAAEDVDVEGAEALLAADAEIVVLDVRTPGEFDAAHLAAAKNIDVDGDGFRDAVEQLDRDKTYLVHCAAGIPGGRSKRSVEIMEELGFAKIYHLDGGINAWKAANKKVEGTAADVESSSPPAR